MPKTTDRPSSQTFGGADWKGVCFVEPASFSETVGARSVQIADAVAAFERIEDEIDGRLASRAFDAPENAQRVSWGDLRKKLDL